MHNIGFAIEMLHFLYFIALAHTGCELYTFYNEYKNCSNKLMILHIKMGGGGGNTGYGFKFVPLFKKLHCHF